MKTLLVLLCCCGFSCGQDKTEEGPWEYACGCTDHHGGDDEYTYCADSSDAALDLMIDRFCGGHEDCVEGHYTCRCSGTETSCEEAGTN